MTFVSDRGDPGPRTRRGWCDYLGAEDKLPGGDWDGTLLSAQGCEGDVRCLLAAHEHGAEGWAHAGAAVQLSHLQRSTTSALQNCSLVFHPTANHHMKNNQGQTKLPYWYQKHVEPLRSLRHYIDLGPQGRRPSPFSCFPLYPRWQFITRGTSLCGSRNSGTYGTVF